MASWPGRSKASPFRRAFVTNGFVPVARFRQQRRQFSSHSRLRWSFGRPTDRSTEGHCLSPSFYRRRPGVRFISGPHSVFISSLDEWTVPLLSVFGTGFRIVRTEVGRTALRISWGLWFIRPGKVMWLGCLVLRPTVYFVYLPWNSGHCLTGGFVMIWKAVCTSRGSLYIFPVKDCFGFMNCSRCFFPARVTCTISVKVNLSSFKLSIQNPQYIHCSYFVALFHSRPLSWNIFTCFLEQNWLISLLSLIPTMPITRNSLSHRLWVYCLLSQ